MWVLPAVTGLGFSPVWIIFLIIFIAMMMMFMYLMLMRRVREMPWRDYGREGPREVREPRRRKVSDTPAGVISMRYASGEITKEGSDQMKTDLG